MSLVMKTWVSEATRTSTNFKTKTTLYSWQARYPRSQDKITNFAGFLEISTDKTIRVFLDNGNKKFDAKKDFLMATWKAKNAPKNLETSKTVALGNYYLAGEPLPGGFVAEFDQITISGGTYGSSSDRFEHAGWVKALGFDPTNINQATP